MIATLIKVIDHPLSAISIREIKERKDESDMNQLRSELWKMVRDGKAKVDRVDDGDRFTIF